jgi:hypothetical protein
VVRSAVSAMSGVVWSCHGATNIGQRAAGNQAEGDWWEGLHKWQDAGGAE